MKAVVQLDTYYVKFLRLWEAGAHRQGSKLSPVAMEEAV